ncbi:MAG TPA: hypothetical protein VJ860_18635 [Polyangia bacterium]|jgi:DNA polymerase I - 3''-5'' exonuclease and polymerase domains|nr:hypothetical protein [Polyangia bacterium]
MPSGIRVVGRGVGAGSGVGSRGGGGYRDGGGDRGGGDNRIASAKALPPTHHLPHYPVKREMEAVYTLRAPLVVDVHSGASWGEAHS